MSARLRSLPSPSRPLSDQFRHLFAFARTASFDRARCSTMYSRLGRPVTASPALRRIARQRFAESAKFVQQGSTAQARANLSGLSAKTRS